MRGKSPHGITQNSVTISTKAESGTCCSLWHLQRAAHHLSASLCWLGVTVGLTVSRKFTTLQYIYACNLLINILCTFVWELTSRTLSWEPEVIISLTSVIIRIKSVKDTVLKQTRPCMGKGFKLIWWMTYLTIFRRSWLFMQCKPLGSPSCISSGKGNNPGFLSNSDLGYFIHCTGSSPAGSTTVVASNATYRYFPTSPTAVVCCKSAPLL